MTSRPTPHDFLLHLRTHWPSLARRLDGIRGMAREGRMVRLSVPEGSWSHRELASVSDGLASAAVEFFGPGTTIQVDARPADPEALPLPVAATKVWNHVAFWSWEGRQACVLAVRKTVYRGRWVPPAGAAEDPDLLLRLYRAPAQLPPGEQPETWLLPGMVEDLYDLARRNRSYVQLVAAFPGDEAADRIEARLYAVKEWGSGRAPAALLQKHVGRIHYVDPDRPARGVRLARESLEGRSGAGKEAPDASI